MSPVDPDGVETAETRAAEMCGAKRPPWVQSLKRIGITLGVVAVLLAVLGIALYNFGGMSGSAVPGVLSQYDQLVASRQAPAVQKRFVIPIPGCRCHSTDPVLTAQHASRHMNECYKCHNTKPAHMEPGVL